MVTLSGVYLLPLAGGPARLLHRHGDRCDVPTLVATVSLLHKNGHTNAVLLVLRMMGYFWWPGLLAFWFDASLTAGHFREFVAAARRGTTRPRFEPWNYGCRQRVLLSRRSWRSVDIGAFGWRRLDGPCGLKSSAKNGIPPFALERNDVSQRRCHAFRLGDTAFCPCVNGRQPDRRGRTGEHEQVSALSGRCAAAGRTCGRARRGTPRPSSGRRSPAPPRGSRIAALAIASATNEPTE